MQLQTTRSNLASAEWADPDEFLEEHHFDDDAGQIWLGRSPIDGSPVGFQDNRHVCLVAGTRGGKGTSVILPNVCTWPGSLVLIDPKGENATVAAARRGNGSDYCEGMGQEVHILDPFKAVTGNDEYQSHFNPLDALDPDHPEIIDQAALIADSLVIVREDSKDPFWEESARALVKTLVLHIMTWPQFEGRRNLVTLRELIVRGDWQGVKALKEINYKNIPTSQQLLWQGVLKNEALGGIISGAGDTYLSMLENNPKGFDGVRQTAITNTEFLDSPGMRECLSRSDFKLSELKTRSNGLSLFLSLPQRYMPTHFRWLRMMVSLITAEMEIVKQPPACDYPVMMLLDEFAGLERMKSIENAVAQIAGYGVKLFFVLQSLEQLKAVYEKSWETFLANTGVKLFFGINDHFTREYVSKMLGETEVMRETSTSSDTSGTNTSNTKGTSESTTEGTSLSETHGSSKSITEGRSTSDTEGTSISETEGTSESQTKGTSESRTRGTGGSVTRGSNYSENQSYNEGSNQSFNESRNRSGGHSAGSNSSHSYGQSGFGSSHGYNHGSNHSAGSSSGSSRGSSKGFSKGSSRGRSKSASRSWNQSFSISRNSSQTFGLNRSRSRSQNRSHTKGYNESLTEGVNESETESSNQSKTIGTSQSETTGSSESKTLGMNQNLYHRPLITPDEIGFCLGLIDDEEHPVYPGLALIVPSEGRPTAVARCNYYEDDFFIGWFDTHPSFPENAPPKFLVDVEIKGLPDPTPLGLTKDTLLEYFPEPELKLYDWLVEPDEKTYWGQHIAVLGPLRYNPDVPHLEEALHDVVHEDVHVVREESSIYWHVRVPRSGKLVDWERTNQANLGRIQSNQRLMHQEEDLLRYDPLVGFSNYVRSIHENVEERYKEIERAKLEQEEAERLAQELKKRLAEEERLRRLSEQQEEEERLRLIARREAKEREAEAMRLAAEKLLAQRQMKVKIIRFGGLSVALIAALIVVIIAVTPEKKAYTIDKPAKSWPDEEIIPLEPKLSFYEKSQELTLHRAIALIRAQEAFRGAAVNSEIEIFDVGSLKTENDKERFLKEQRAKWDYTSKQTLKRQFLEIPKNQKATVRLSQKGDPFYISPSGMAIHVETKVPIDYTITIKTSDMLRPSVKFDGEILYSRLTGEGKLEGRRHEEPYLYYYINDEYPTYLAPDETKMSAVSDWEYRDPKSM